MKRRITTIVVLCCALLIALVGTAAADPPDRVVASGHVVLTDPGPGVQLGQHYYFRYHAWEGTKNRPSGGWRYIRFLSADGVVLAELTQPIRYVNIQNGMAAIATDMGSLGWDYEILSDLGEGAQDTRDTIRSHVTLDESQAATWVDQMMYFPQRTWTLTYGNIRVVE